MPSKLRFLHTCFEQLFKPGDIIVSLFFCNVAQAKNEQIRILLKDASKLAGIRNKRLANVLASTQIARSNTPHSDCPGTIPLLIYPHYKYGNLKQFLRKTVSGGSDEHSAVVLTVDQLVSMGLQILSAVDYLHGMKIIHGDVATRNCLYAVVNVCEGLKPLVLRISDDSRRGLRMHEQIADRIRPRLDIRYDVSLSDSALSRDLFPEDYHCLGDNTNRPIKWLAIEALVERKFSTATDVWSFGITMWELITKGQQPYAMFDPFEMPNVLYAGYRLRQPPNCPDTL
ncbi:unnamed protein product [Echinostoma caproni]|uniref:Protein kinase domain-containing protein n=1 Tax=Echinostoma caproni TaxID=27848 RepID=A0A183A6N8_9TREM|nr:unnamed protein product [Echinostoma caproni]